MELNGLKVIVSNAVENGTLHGIQAPPKREAFASGEDYERAYHEWWTMVHAWKVINIDV